MRLSLPSIGTSCDTSQSGDENSFSSVELDGFVFHLSLAARIVQILLTTSGDIPSGRNLNSMRKKSNIAIFVF